MLPNPKEIGAARTALWWAAALGGFLLLVLTPKIVFDSSMKWLALIVPILCVWITWLAWEYMRWGWGGRRR